MACRGDPCGHPHAQRLLAGTNRETSFGTDLGTNRELCDYYVLEYALYGAMICRSCRDGHYFWRGKSNKSRFKGEDLGGTVGNYA